MIPLSVFLLACAAVYLGTIEAAFSALMRLSLRLVAERSDRPARSARTSTIRCCCSSRFGCCSASSPAPRRRCSPAASASMARTRSDAVARARGIRAGVRAVRADDHRRPRSRAHPRIPAADVRADRARHRSADALDRRHRARRTRAPGRRRRRTKRPRRPTKPPRPTSTPRSRKGSSKAKSAGCCRASSTSATRWSARS